MAKQDFIPSREDELIPWFENFSTKLPNYQVVLGLTAPELTAVTSDFLLLEATLLTVNQAKQEQREWVAFKNVEFYGPLGEPTPQVPGWPAPFALSAKPPGMLFRIRDLAARIKAHPAYTEQMGADLGIIGAEALGPITAQPTGSATPLAGFAVEVAFLKQGFAGVDVESQRGSEMTWTYLAFDAFSPYVDNRPPLVAGQAEQRRYRLRYRDGDEPVGVYSDVLVANVGP
jgi:hypothetical protein